MENELIKKYIFNIIFTFIVITVLTFLWFGPYKSKVRIKESLMAYNIDFNKSLKYKGFDYLELSNKMITKDLVVENTSSDINSYIISFDNYTNSDNNYINYYITDSEGNRSSVRSLNLDGFILANKIKGKEKKNYTITMWSDYNIEGNLKLLLNPVKV